LCLAKSLRGLNSSNENIRANALTRALGLSGKFNETDALQQGCKNIIDVMSRNFWYDDNIISPIYISPR
jgi:hypothetical protein